MNWHSSLALNRNLESYDIGHMEKHDTRVKNNNKVYHYIAYSTEDLRKNVCNRIVILFVLDIIFETSEINFLSTLCNIQEKGRSNFCPIEYLAIYTRDACRNSSRSSGKVVMKTVGNKPKFKGYLMLCGEI
jgi:hypothetical protein